MISRVIEAKPEELRMFLEEAAGVSKYKERRKRDRRARLSDTRENLVARRAISALELGNQLARLEEQARVAAQYRELEERHRQAQHLMWHAKAAGRRACPRSLHDGDRDAHRRARSVAGGRARTPKTQLVTLRDRAFRGRRRAARHGRARSTRPTPR